MTSTYIQKVVAGADGDDDDLIVIGLRLRERGKMTIFEVTSNIFISADFRATCTTK